MVEENDLRDYVLFLGTRDDIPQLLSSMDIFLFPSLHEGFSVCSIEVQSSGLPIVSSNIPSMRESDLTGLLSFVDLDRSSADWANAMCNISTDIDRSSYNGVVFKKGFDIKTIAQKLENEYIQYGC